jgi:hypothetical protein
MNKLRSRIRKLSVALLVLAVNAEPSRRLRQRTGDTSSLRASPNTQPRNRRYLIQYENADGEALLLQHATQLHHWFANEYLMSVDLEDEAVLLLENSPGIVAIERDTQWLAQGYLERMVDPSELHEKQGRFLTSEQNPDEIIPYGIFMVQADQVTMGGTPITVCIVDTGIELEHPDLDANLVTGADRETEDAAGVSTILRWNNDSRGHGTHVAGTIMAKANNGIGVRGMGQIPIFVTRGLDDSGNAFESDIREAIEQCEAAGAQIVSLSLGGNEMSNAMQSLIQRLYNEKNMLIFAAAGNAGEWKLEYPASDPTVISVSAVDETEWFWDQANYGPTLELMAPGVGILSTSVNSSGSFNYAEYSGTSMAVPHASAAAALVWSHHPECTNHQIRFVLAATAKDMGEAGCDTDFGYGIVQVKSALDFLDAYPCLNATWGGAPMTGNCTILDVPMDQTVDEYRDNTKSPVAAPTFLSDAPVMTSRPLETISPSAVGTSTESPSAPSKERIDETEPPTADIPKNPLETEPPNLDDPAPFEFPEGIITGEQESEGPMKVPEGDNPSKSAGPVDSSVTVDVPPSRHPLDPELPGVTVLEIPPVYAPSEKVSETDQERTHSPTALPTVVQVPTPLPSMIPTSPLEEAENKGNDEISDTTEEEEEEEEEEDSTEDPMEGAETFNGEATNNGFDGLEDGTPARSESTFSAFLSPFDGTGPASPLVPRPKRDFFPKNQVSSITRPDRRNKRPSIWN